MKKLLLLATVLLTASSLFAEDFVAPQQRRRRVTQPGRVRQPTNFDGAIPRGVQSGNPLQMLNPFAPKEYGNGADLVSDEQGPPTPRPQYKVGRGFRLLSIEF